ncbi:hypothetical protein AC249_AIPGENE21571 [Exaiptasia diaphana]|nr:hypothetical protein AC249_AIPGENE21571 [Exaiptasia diaphana]
MFKGVAALLPILGIAWSLGFAANFHWILLYISIVVNSSQGIFLCVVHCFMDEEQYPRDHFNNQSNLLVLFWFSDSV